MKRKILVCSNISGNILWNVVWEVQNASANILSKFTFSYWELGTTSIPIFFLCSASITVNLAFFKCIYSKKYLSKKRRRVIVCSFRAFFCLNSCNMFLLYNKADLPPCSSVISLSIKNLKRKCFTHRRQRGKQVWGLQAWSHVEELFQS